MLQDFFTYMTTAPGPDVDPVRAAALNAVQALIGTRLYPDFLAERSGPGAGRYVLIVNEQGYTLDGDPFDFESPTLQVDWYAPTPEDRNTLGEQAKIALSGYRGNMGGTNIGILMFETEFNGYDEKPLLYSRTQHYKVVHYSNDSEMAPSNVPGIPGARRHSPVETPDGFRTSFTFLGIPTQADLFLLVVNGLVSSSGFTQSGDIITFATALAIDAEIYAYY